MCANGSVRGLLVRAQQPHHGPQPAAGTARGALPEELALSADAGGEAETAERPALKSKVESAKPCRATKEGQSVLRALLPARSLVCLCSAWF